MSQSNVTFQLKETRHQFRLHQKTEEIDKADHHNRHLQWLENLDGLHLVHQSLLQSLTKEKRN
jgi:hypothetical protein